MASQVPLKGYSSQEIHATMFSDPLLRQLSSAKLLWQVFAGLVMSFSSSHNLEDAVHYVPPFYIQASLYPITFMLVAISAGKHIRQP